MTALLAKYVRTAHDVSGFAYGAVTAPDKRALEDYLARLQALAPSEQDEAEQRAFWINLYNALTVAVVLDHYPLKSIREIGEDEVWSKPRVRVEGEAYSLSDIENGILRARWRDPRVHYAINCASASCPNLMPRAFTGATLEAMLEDGARDYVNHTRAVEVLGDTAHFSRIFAWYASDFGADEKALLQHLQRYAAPELKSRLARVARVGVYHYDWSLNDATQGGER
jgi:hypothetical protein